MPKDGSRIGAVLQGALVPIISLWCPSRSKSIRRRDATCDSQQADNGDAPLIAARDRLQAARAA